MKREKNLDIPKRLAKAKVFNGKIPKDTKYLILEPKLDGLRGIIIVRKNKAEAYTSNGLPVVNAGFICKQLMVLRDVLGYDFVLDGEFYTEDWNKSQSLVMTQTNHPDAEKLMLNAFDLISYEVWKKKGKTPTLWYRKKYLIEGLSEAFRKIKHPKITIVDHEVVDIPREWTDNDTKRMLAYAENMVKKGYEGCMIKLNTPYSFKRSGDWLKIKMHQDVDVKIIDVKPGNGKYIGLVGSLKCTFKKGSKTVTFNSSGMADELRKKFTRMHSRGELIGRIIEVRHEGITVNDKVRFPRFIRIRDDK